MHQIEFIQFTVSFNSADAGEPKKVIYKTGSSDLSVKEVFLTLSKLQRFVGSDGYVDISGVKLDGSVNPDVNLSNFKMHDDDHGPKSSKSMWRNDPESAKANERRTAKDYYKGFKVYISCHSEYMVEELLQDCDELATSLGFVRAGDSPADLLAERVVRLVLRKLNKQIKKTRR